jgi:hypothetical protein
VSRTEHKVSVVTMRSCLAASQPVVGKPGSEENVPELPVQPGPEHVTATSETDEPAVQNPKNVPELQVQPGPESVETSDPPHMRISSSSFGEGDIINKHSVTKSKAEPDKLGNMMPNAQNDAENDEEKSVMDDIMEEPLVGVDKIGNLAEGDNFEHSDSKLTVETLTNLGLPPEANIPAEIGQLSSTSSNGLILPLLLLIIDGSSCLESITTLAAGGCLPENNPDIDKVSCSGTGPLYKYLRS